MKCLEALEMLEVLEVVEMLDMLGGVEVLRELETFPQHLQRVWKEEP